MDFGESSGEGTPPPPQGAAAQSSPDIFAEEFATNSESLCSLNQRLSRVKCSGALRKMTAMERQAGALMQTQGLDAESTICDHHLNLMYNASLCSGRACSNPFQKHGTRKTQLTPVSPYLAAVFNANGHTIKPNSPLCKDCMSSARQLPIEMSQSPPDAGATIGPPSGPSSQITPQEKAKADLNTILNATGVDPLQLEDYHERQKVQAAKAKYTEVMMKVKETLFAAINVTCPPDLHLDEFKTRALDYENLLSSLKILVNEASYRNKIKLLTLAPDSMSQKEVADFFGATVHQVKLSRRLKEKKGILGELDPKRGRRISEEDIDLVLKFFNDDEYSRMCPGRKDTVRVGKKEHVQKRLLLGTLDELYAEFKQNNPDCKVGKSKFCELKPKWCVSTQAAGSHNVCVCKYHENIRMLQEAIDMKKEELSELIASVQCDNPKMECHLRLCPDCCKKDIIIEKVKCLVKKSLGEESDEFIFSEDEDCEVEIEFKQWVSTDRVNLEIRKVTVSEFVEIFTDKLLFIIPHSYITRTQNNFIKQMKENLVENTAVVLMDFAENLSFCIQDEIQSYHFKRGQCSIHPVSITYKDSNGISNVSLCFISDDLNHDVSFVQTVIKHVTKFIKDNFPLVSKVEYVSDGCAAQYKNCKCFLKVCQHLVNFGLQARWTFFASSHGKSVCDGIGGAVKRAAFHESLRRVKLNSPPISDVNSLLSFCKLREEQKKTEVKHFLITKEEIETERELQKLQNPKTIQGTRSFHSFEPLSSSVIGCKYTSIDPEYAVVIDMNKEKEKPQEEWKTGTFVACAINSDWHSAFINEIDYDEQEAHVVLLTRKGRVKSKVYWEENNVIFITLDQIICELEVDIQVDSINVLTPLRRVNDKFKAFKKDRPQLYSA